MIGSDLTDRQREIVTFMVRFFCRHWIWPTIRDICRNFRIRSTNGAADHLRALELKGYVMRSDLISRGSIVPRWQEWKAAYLEGRS